MTLCYRVGRTHGTTGTLNNFWKKTILIVEQLFISEYAIEKARHFISNNNTLTHLLIIISASGTENLFRLYKLTDGAISEFLIGDVYLTDPMMN